MIPAFVEAHLRQWYRHYQHHAHRSAETALELAAAEHVSGRRVAKSVVLELDGQPALAVVAATDRVDVPRLEAATGARVSLAPEAALEAVFAPCDVGAEPPLAVFGVPIFVDEKLVHEKELVFPAGTYRDAVVVDPDEWAWCERARVIEHLGRPGRDG